MVMDLTYAHGLFVFCHLSCPVLISVDQMCDKFPNLGEDTQDMFCNDIGNYSVKKKLIMHLYFV